jgi:hypothetical protein
MLDESSVAFVSVVVGLGWDELAALTDPMRARVLKVLEGRSLRCSSRVAVRDRVRWFLVSIDVSSSRRSMVRDRMVVRGEGALLVRCSGSDKGE